MGDLYALLVCETEENARRHAHKGCTRDLLIVLSCRVFVC